MTAESTRRWEPQRTEDSRDDLARSAEKALEAAFSRGVQRGIAASARATGWGLTALAGRFAEISGDAGGAPLTLVFRLVLEAQRMGEPVAWIGRRGSPFYPPDVADAGVDLAALPVVWAPDVLAAARATDLLVRSGAFGLVVVDLGTETRLSIAGQTRLAGLAKQHEAALVFLTEKGGDRPSLGSLVSIRAHAVHAGHDADQFHCELRAVKDKRRGPGWRHAETYRGPDGLR